MKKQSPEAAAILALPHHYHPKLRGAVQYLAGLPNMTADCATAMLDEIRLEVGVSDLDLEMVQPGSATSVPFAPSSVGHSSDYQQGVAAMVHAQIFNQKGAS